MTLRQNILDLARDQGVTIATAESCTGGMISAALTDLAGSSAVFEYGFDTYSNTAKVQLLGVQQDTLDAYGAVSEEVAKQMCEGARAASGADIAIAVTGIAGPGGSDHKPEGRVCFGITSKTGTRTETVEFGAIGRENVRSATRDHALSLVFDRLSHQEM